MYQYVLQVNHTVFNRVNLSRRTVSWTVWTATCNSLFIFEGPYLLSNLFWDELGVARMAVFTSRRQRGNHAMCRTRLWTETQGTDRCTNSCSSSALYSTLDAEFITTLITILGNTNVS